MNVNPTTAHVEVFSGTGCVYCLRAKQLLDGRGIAFVDYDITQTEHKEALLARLPRSRTIPQIFIDGAHIGGFDDLALLEREGQLAGLTAVGGNSRDAAGDGT